MTRIADAVERLKGIYLESPPGSQLSAAELARLSGLDESTCDDVIAALQDARFLRRCADGRLALDTHDPDAAPQRMRPPRHAV